MQQANHFPTLSFSVNPSLYSDVTREVTLASDEGLNEQLFPLINRLNIFDYSFSV